MSDKRRKAGERRQVPFWFEEAGAGVREGAVARFHGGRLPPLHLGPDDDAQPVPGEIRLALEAEQTTGDGLRRLVVVRSVERERRHASVALISDEVSMAGRRDMVLDSSTTGLPSSVMIETDLVGPVLLDQLSPALGRLGAVELEALIAAEGAAPETEAVAAAPAAEQVLRRFKQLELQEFSVLVRPCLSMLRLRAEAAAAVTGRRQAGRRERPSSRQEHERED